MIIKNESKYTINIIMNKKLYYTINAKNIFKILTLNKKQSIPQFLIYQLH